MTNLLCAQPSPASRSPPNARPRPPSATTWRPVGRRRLARRPHARRQRPSAEELITVPSAPLNAYPPPSRSHRLRRDHRARHDPRPKCPDLQQALDRRRTTPAGTSAAVARRTGLEPQQAPPAYRQRMHRVTVHRFAELSNGGISMSAATSFLPERADPSALGNSGNTVRSVASAERIDSRIVFRRLFHQAVNILVFPFQPYFCCAILRIEPCCMIVQVPERSCWCIL